MLFEEFDKKLRNAAAHHHPAYDEKAWEKMKKLLDKHMPEEKDRRRILFFVILAFLGLGGGTLVILQPWKNNNPVVLEKTGISPIENKTELVPVQNTEPAPDLQPTNDQQVTETAKRNFTIASRIQEKLPVFQPEKTSPVEKQNELEKNSDPILTDIKADPYDPFSLRTEKKTEPAKIDLAKSTDQAATTSTPEQTNSPKKARNRKQHTFFVSVSGGPDKSFVDNKSGTTKLFGGAGLGYTYNNRISIRTGYYSGRKIYSAGADAYNPPPGFYAYYPFLEKVDANCKVYEVPVYLSYHFGKSPGHQFFASAGVSSYFMKEEEYKYYYKYSQNGPTLTKSRTLRDINKHQLAGLTFSGGYTKKLTRHISLTAEPYVKIPLTGVGYGKVKLNSAGISMSATVNPFAKKPK